MSEKERKNERISRRKKGKKAKKGGRDREGGNGKEGKKEKKKEGRKKQTASPMDKSLNICFPKENIQMANMRKCSTSWSSRRHKLKPQ